MQEASLVEPMSSEATESRLAVHLDGCDARSAQLRAAGPRRHARAPTALTPCRDFYPHPLGVLFLTFSRDKRQEHLSARLQLAQSVRRGKALHSPMPLAIAHRTMEPDSRRDDPPDLQTKNGAAGGDARPAR